MESAKTPRAVDQKKQVGELVGILQKAVDDDLHHVLALFRQCNVEFKFHQKLTRPILNMRTSTKSDHKLCKAAFNSLRANAPTVYKRAIERNIPLERFAYRLAASLAYQRKRCLLNSLGALRVHALEEQVRQEWQEKLEKDKKEVRQMKKEVKERWLQVQQRELRGIEKERELSRDKTSSRNAQLAGK